MEKERLVQLVQDAQGGDNQAMDALFTAFYNDVYYFALKTVKDSDLACDITQETFLKVIQNIGELKEPAAFVTWMKQITYHECTHYFSKKKEVLVEEDEDGNTIFDTLPDEGEMPAEVLEQEEFRQTILSMIEQLTEEQRAAVLLYYFDELTVSQIAQIQGVSEGTVKSRLNYARKAIKKSVESYEKKHDVKLHSVALLPLLLLFFGKEAMPEAKAAAARKTVLGAAGNTQAAFAAVTTTQIAAAKAAATGGMFMNLAKLPLIAKIIAGVVAASLVVGTGVLVFGGSSDEKSETAGGATVETTAETTGKAAVETTGKATVETTGEAAGNTESDNSGDKKPADKAVMFPGKAIRYKGIGGAVYDSKELKYDAATRTITMTCYNASGEMDREYRYEYDEAGNRIRCVKHNDRVMLYDDRYEYDAAGNLTRAYSYDDKGKFEGEEIYEYDAAGNKTRWAIYNSAGKLEWEYRYEYDAAGNLLRKAYFDSKGKPDGEYRYEYDTAGNMTQEAWYDVSGKMEDRYNCEYDAAGNMIRESWYDADGKQYRECRYEYDAAGNQTRHAQYNADGRLEFDYRCEYDAAGKMTCYGEYDADGKLEDDDRYEYDATGNPTRVYSYDADGKLDDEIKYEYDANGNLTHYTRIAENGDRANLGYRYENYQEIPFFVKDTSWVEDIYY